MGEGGGVGGRGKEEGGNGKGRGVGWVETGVEGKGEGNVEGLKVGKRGEGLKGRVRRGGEGRGRGLPYGAFLEGG